MQDLTDKKIIELFKDKINDENVISDVFDFLEFDCLSRKFIDSNDLDKRIKEFYNNRDIDLFISIFKAIKQAKKDATLDEDAFLKEILDYIDGNLAEEFTFEQMAKELHISYYYLCHFFNKKTGQSLTRYRTTKRLKKAIKTLLGSDLKISDVATACGFDNVSYFSETFIKYLSESPSDFRKNHANCHIHDFYEFEDMLLASKMDSASFLSDKITEIKLDNLAYTKVHDPSEEFGYFLHECAIIEYEGVLYASWYNCREKELVGVTPIVARRSFDMGKTWTDAEIIVDHKDESIIYCPPVYGICDGKLYMLINEMLGGDLMHALDLYVLNKDTDKFEFVWSRPIPFKLNTNVVKLPNGKLLLPGRIAEMDSFPNTPAVLISDSGKIDAEWRLVKVAENGNLPDGDNLVHPETTVICEGDTLYLFNRNDKKRVPLVYISKDYGESWTKQISHDIPYVSTKLYGGELSDGRFYLVCNIDKFNRSKLALFISEKGKLKFDKKIILKDCDDNVDDIIKCHYPACYESDGVLYIIATADYNGQTLRGRGAILFKVDLRSI